MKTTRRPALRLVPLALALLAPPPSPLRADEGITAVFARASDDYVRQRQPDGSFERESYAFGKGGYLPAPVRDGTIDSLGYMDIARTLAVPLGAQNYVPAADPGSARLLIMVYWGQTYGSMDNIGVNYLMNGRDAVVLESSTQRAMTDHRNAEILGYAGELGQYGMKANYGRGDLESEIEYGRYFVVLMAYDFQALWKDRKHRLLWETRFSVRELGNDFTVVLPAMAKYASPFFGQDSHGLLRTKVPDGRIDVGDPTIIGYLSSPRR
jgi:hypothetical protein